MFYITGDTHGKFSRIEKFCKRYNTTQDDILIILGDAGINYNSAKADLMKKHFLQSLPITLFAIHGNHENRPTNIMSYSEKLWHDGLVYYEENYPNILFGKDGEIYDFDGKKVIVIGGAYSVDKYQRLAYGYPWYYDEQPSDEIKDFVEKQLDKHNWNIDIILSHTSPICYEPKEAFLPGLDQSKVDKSTEMWLGSIEYKLNYKKWYCGHYHIEKKIDKIEFMFENYDILKIENE